MPLVFHSEDLYTYLKVEAARRHIAASDIVADVVREWLEKREDAELVPLIESVRAEWKEKGGRPWSEVEHEIDEAVRIEPKQPTKVQNISEEAVAAYSKAEPEKRLAGNWLKFMDTTIDITGGNGLW